MNVKRIIIGGIIVLFILLADIFAILKCYHIITWSWLWVLAPIWIPVAIIGALILILPVLFFILAIFED